MSLGSARLTTALVALGAEGEVFVIERAGRPKAKARPRAGTTFGGRRNAYTTPKDRAAEAITAEAIGAIIDQPLTGNLAMACLFYYPTLNRVDLDNLQKHVQDAANGVAFVDDQQLTATANIIELDRDNPRTIIAIARHRSTLTRK